MRTTVALMLNLILAPLASYADGGAVLLREASGSFVVTVFAAPAAPRVGPLETSVLVQDQSTGTVILDSTVNLELQPIANSNPPFPTRATLGKSKNRLLQVATIDVPAPGWWGVIIFVRRGREQVVLATRILIMPAAPRLATFWPFFIIPPLAICLFALHQTLKHFTIAPGTAAAAEDQRRNALKSWPLAR